MNCSIEILNHFENIITKRIENKQQEIAMKYVQSFYNELPKKSIEFIHFTTKTYQLLLQKMEAHTHNETVLKNEDDADTLALYIANCYFNGDVNLFFQSYGITLDKVLKFLNLSITKAEIEAMGLNTKTLVDRYKRFVYSGVNQNFSKEAININRIVYNLCNREFNRSSIMEEIFASLVAEGTLNSDFYEQMKNCLQEKEQLRRQKLTEKLFHDIPIETVELLENTSRIHHCLIKQDSNLSIADKRVMALLLSLVMSSDEEVKKFFKYNEITESKTRSYLGIPYQTFDNLPIDIDVLASDYAKYIYGGNNKNVARKNITVHQIASNIFNRELHDSIVIARFLSQCNKTYEDFENFEEKYQSYLEQTKEERQINKAKKLLEFYSYDTSSYIKNVLIIHEKIANQVEDDHINKEIISDDNDIAELSMVLSLFTVFNTAKKFFKKRNLLPEKILKYCQLDANTLDDLKLTEGCYPRILTIYRKYTQHDSLDDTIKGIFDVNLNSSLVLEKLCAHFGINYDILKTEVKTDKDYETFLSLEQRIELLDTSPVDSLEVNDYISILHFGNSLIMHSQYIHDEFPKLAANDTHDSSIETINQMIDKVIVKKEEKKKTKSLFQRLFSIDVEDEKPQFVLNPDAIEELKKAIATNIDTLSEELLMYDAIRKYMKAYRKKNQLYYQKAAAMAKDIEEKLSLLDAENEDDFPEILDVNSQLRIMKNKANRFSDSNQLILQELINVNQAIVNHYITLSALEKARDDFLPLIVSQLAIGKGINTESQSIELSQNIIQLFQSLLTRNVEGARQNMEQLKSLVTSSDTLLVLDHDIESYLQDLKQATTLKDATMTEQLPDTTEPEGISMSGLDTNIFQSGISSVSASTDSKKMTEKHLTKKLKI